MSSAFVEVQQFLRCTWFHSTKELRLSSSICQQGFQEGLPGIPRAAIPCEKEKCFLWPFFAFIFLKSLVTPEVSGPSCSNPCARGNRWSCSILFLWRLPLVLEPFSRLQLLYYYLKIIHCLFCFQNSCLYLFPFSIVFHCFTSWWLLVVNDRAFLPVAMILRAAACLWSTQNTQELELRHTGAEGSRASRKWSTRTCCYQTSTDWIWFICALITWILFRIFFWCPAKVTPTRRMSLWEEGNKHHINISKDEKVHQNKAMHEHPLGVCYAGSCCRQTISVALIPQMQWMNES